MHICPISSSMMDRDITMASSSSTENNNINNNEGSNKPSESVQITGLELLTGQEPTTTATTTAAASAVKSNPNNRPTNTTIARPMLSPKKAPAFIRGGKKKIVRTKSMPTTTSNKRGTSSSPKPTTSNTRRLQAPPPLLQQQHHQQQSPKAASSGARRRNMNRSGGLSPQRPSNSSQQSPQQKQPLARASSARMVGQRRASMGASLNISGHAALPRISRRVSIGNEQVGVTQTTWGLKPMRRSSLTHANKTGGGNYQYAANSQLHAPPISTSATAAQQQQQQHQRNHHHQHQNNNAHQMQTQTQNYMMVETAQDSFSRRSSLSSHGSDFSELGDSGSTAASGAGIAYLTNVASLGYNTPHAAAPHLSLLHHQQQQEQQQQRRLSNDSGFTDYSYANDSLDLRKKNPKKNSATRNNRMSVDKNDDQDFDDDSFGDDDDTYAADSLDLRQYRKKKQGSAPPPQSQTQQSSSQRMAVDRDDYDNDDDSYYDDDDSIGDDDTYAADSLDLRRKSSSVRHVVERQSSLNLDDSAASSAYSCAADSLDMRKVGDKMHAKHVIPSREELGYGEDNNDDTIKDNDDNQYHNKTTHMSNTTTKNDDTAVVDLGYGDTGPSRRISAEDLGYGDVAPERKTGGGAWQDDEDSFGTYSYAADSLDLRLKQRKTGATARTESTAAEDDDDYYDDNDDDDDEDYEDDEDCEVETGSNKTPVDYMTRIVMGYSKKNKESEPAQASTDENDDGSNDEDDDDSRVHDDDDDDDDAEEDDEDSNKTPVDYMTQIVMGYANSNKNETSDGAGMMGRRTSEGSTASSIYSYACDSVVMKPTLSKNANKTIDIKSSGPPTSLAKASPYANREGYDDDDDEDDEEYSDYTDDEEDVDYRRRGGGGGGGGGRNSAYLSGVLGYGHQNKPKLVASTSFDTGMERRFSCDSYANDSVNMRKAGGEKKKKKSFGEARRESMDSLTSGISTNDLDPSYLNNVLGYAMDASANSANNTNDPRELLINAPYAASSMMDSMTSMGSESEGEWALSPTIPQQRKPKVPMSTSKAMQTSATSLGAFSTDTSASEGLGYEDMGMS